MRVGPLLPTTLHGDRSGLASDRRVCLTAKAFCTGFAAASTSCSSGIMSMGDRVGDGDAPDGKQDKFATIRGRALSPQRQRPAAGPAGGNLPTDAKSRELLSWLALFNDTARLYGKVADLLTRLDKGGASIQEELLTFTRQELRGELKQQLGQVFVSAGPACGAYEAACLLLATVVALFPLIRGIMSQGAGARGLRYSLRSCCRCKVRLVHVLIGVMPKSQVNTEACT